MEMTDEEGNRYLLVLDDAITSNFKQNKSGRVDAFSSLVTKYRHIKNEHTGCEGNLSIVLTLQYFKFLTPITRTMSMGIIIAGEMSESELKKISEAYDFMAPNGNTRAWLENYRKCKKEPFDICFMNVDSLEMRRNFDTLVWSKKQDRENKIEKELKEIEIKQEKEESDGE